MNYNPQTFPSVALDFLSLVSSRGQGQELWCVKRWGWQRKQERGEAIEIPSHYRPWAWFCTIRSCLKETESHNYCCLSILARVPKPENSFKSIMTLVKLAQAKVLASLPPYLTGAFTHHPPGISLTFPQVMMGVDCLRTLWTHTLCTHARNTIHLRRWKQPPNPGLKPTSSCFFFF